MPQLTHYLLLSLAILSGANASSAVLDLIPDNFDKVVLQSGKPALVEFFAPWCGHCKTLAPTYEELAQKFAFAGNKLSIAKVDADEHKMLGRRFGVQGFPTLKWFDGKSDKPEDYKGGRDLDSLVGFVSEKTGVRPKGVGKAAGVPSQVRLLDDQSFKREVGGNRSVLVAFTAPWCGHCKSLAPVWETVANDFSSEPSVMIAKVDAEAANARATAQEQDIEGFPTIKYFPRGSTKATMYKGGRSEKDFVAFVNQHAGTHRAVGGGLDDEAGTIEELDEVVSKVGQAGQDLSAVLDEARKVVAKKDSGSSVSAEYYLRVLQKLRDRKEYVDKEFARLKGISEKGNLAREKLDQLKVKMNILRKFAVGKKGGDDEKDEL
ncbi:MAG: Protein disulfide-isomerase-like 2-2 [Peltula sp. TS41687]|nr:MAG: Protein disulfide-isomerase-like 2-2 [Peltula sp. TS41687]